MIKRRNKRAQGLSTNAIILLILGVFILAIMILGFMIGWSPLKNLMNPTNVDSLIEDCQTVCGLNQKYSFCSAERTLRVNEENFEVETSCAVLSGVSDFSKYKIQKCPSIECELSCEDIVIEGKKGVKSSEGKYDVSSLANNLENNEKCFVE